MGPELFDSTRDVTMEKSTEEKKFCMLFCRKAPVIGSLVRAHLAGPARQTPAPIPLM